MQKMQKFLWKNKRPYPKNSTTTIIIIDKISSTLKLNQATVIVLITCSLLVTSRQYIGRKNSRCHYENSIFRCPIHGNFWEGPFLYWPYLGDPIDCIVDPDVPQNVMDTYCWIHSTFSIPNRYEGRNEVMIDLSSAMITVNLVNTWSQPSKSTWWTWQLCQPRANTGVNKYFVAKA